MRKDVSTGVVELHVVPMPFAEAFVESVPEEDVLRLRAFLLPAALEGLESDDNLMQCRLVVVRERVQEGLGILRRYGGQSSRGPRPYKVTLGAHLEDLGT